MFTAAQPWAKSLRSRNFLLTFQILRNFPNKESPGSVHPLQPFHKRRSTVQSTFRKFPRTLQKRIGNSIKLELILKDKDNSFLFIAGCAFFLASSAPYFLLQHANQYRWYRSLPKARYLIHKPSTVALVRHTWQLNPTVDLLFITSFIPSYSRDSINILHNRQKSI